MKCKHMFKVETLIFASLIFNCSCSPIKSSPKEEKHQLELTLHEVRTNLDDLRHDLNCFQTELQIIDGKLKQQEGVIDHLKQLKGSKQDAKLELMLKELNLLEGRLSSFEKKIDASLADLQKLSNHANETSSALSQHKERLNELEKDFIVQNRKLEDIVKIKESLENIATNLKSDLPSKNYKVKAGDSLEKIAKANKTSAEEIKKLNNLDNDLIVIGQELKIPKSKL